MAELFHQIGLRMDPSGFPKRQDRAPPLNLYKTFAASMCVCGLGSEDTKTPQADEFKIMKRNLSTLFLRSRFALYFSASSGLFRGSILIIFVSLLSTIMSAIGKYLAGDYHVSQVIWSRYVFLLPLILMFCRPSRLRSLVRASLHLQVARALFSISAAILLVASFRFLPLADAVTIMYCYPLLAAALSVPILGERVGVRRWAVIILAFLGVIIVMRPGTGQFQLGALLSLASALFMAFFHITTRVVSQAHDQISTFLCTVLTGAVVTTIAVPFFWNSPSVAGWLAMIGSGLTFGLASWLLIRAFSFAPVSALAPFSYTSIVFAILVGLLVFDEVPDLASIVGAAVIILSGLCSLYWASSPSDPRSDLHESSYGPSGHIQLGMTDELAARKSKSPRARIAAVEQPVAVPGPTESQTGVDGGDSRRGRFW